MYIFFLLWWQCSFPRWVTDHEKADYIRILLHATVPLKITITSAEERRGLPVWGPVWSQWWNEKVDLFCQALFLSLDAFLANKSLCEREKGENWTYVPRFSESVIFFSGRSPAERKRGRASRLKWAKITRCILSKTSLLSLCHCRTMERPGLVVTVGALCLTPLPSYCAIMRSN